MHGVITEIRNDKIKHFQMRQSCTYQIPVIGLASFALIINIGKVIENIHALETIETTLQLFGKFRTKA